MDLPSFIWLWRIAAWSMGLALVAYAIQAVTGAIMALYHHPRSVQRTWRRSHVTVGIVFVSLVLALLAIGIVGTLGHFGSLGHSPHLAAGLTVVVLTLLSAFSAWRISPQRPYMRGVHVSTNIVLCFALLWVLLTGWDVVQKYL